MRIFLTGATGFIGTALIPELIANGHQVLGMTRSDEGAKALAAAGAEVHKGTLEDVDSLRAGAAKADGVIHCAFDHNFANFVANCEKDHRAIAALADALVGTDRPLVITSGAGTGAPGPGQLATEDVFNRDFPHPRKMTELAGEEAAARGVNVSVVRLPQVHDPYKQGLISYLIPLVREKGVSAFVGDGSNSWSAAHVSDVARLYRLVVERAEPNSRYHAVAEEGVSMREIAEVLGEGMNLPVKSIAPEQAQEHFGWLAMFANLSMPASSALTRKWLDWEPTGPTLIEDLKLAKYEGGRG